MTALDESGPLSGTSAPFHPAKEWLIALMIVVAGLGLYTARLKPHILNSYDQPLYLATAAEAGALGPGPHDKPLSMTIAPLYPAFIAVLTHLDPRLAATVACVPAPQDGHLESCPNDLGLLVWAQLLLAAGTGLLLWRTANQVTLSRSSAWIALIAASFGSAEYAEYAHAAMTETLTFFLFAGFDLAFLLSIERRSIKAALVAGALLGLTTLTRPIYLYLALAILAAALAIATWHAVARRAATKLPTLRLGVSFAVAFAAIVGPWIARNALVFGVANITEGYAPFVLVQRLAYDDMRPKEWLAGWIYFLPDFGHSWAKALLPAENYERLGYDTPDTLYAAGVDQAATTAPLGAQGPSIVSLIRSDILPHLGTFIAVTLLLAWRGLWIGRYFSVVTVPMLFWRLARVKAPRWPALAIVASPPLFVLFLNAAVSGDAARYNIILEPVMAIAAGQIINSWAMRWRERSSARRLAATEP